VFEGKFYSEYKMYVKAEQTDVTLPISLILAAKDEAELVFPLVMVVAMRYGGPTLLAHHETLSHHRA
jgi:hypothetical protein